MLNVSLKLAVYSFLTVFASQICAATLSWPNRNKDSVLWLLRVRMWEGLSIRTAFDRHQNRWGGGENLKAKVLF